ncbi:MAG: YIP1 family protein [Candidatus Zixiibacteriota bacterium]
MEPFANEANDLQYTEMSPFLRFFGLFYSPKETFMSLTRSKWAWIFPILVTALVVTACFPFMRDVLAKDQVRRLENSSLLESLPKEQRQEIIDNSRESILNPPIWQYAIGFAFPYIAALAVGAILLMIGNIFLGGDAKYFQMLTVYAFSALIGIPETIIKTFLIHSKGSTDVATSLAVVLGSSDTTSFLYALLNKFDIFTAWMMSVLIIGMTVFLPRVSGKKITIGVISFWLIWTIIISLASSFTGGAFGF